jgi:DNA-binding MarR family transcriptional regulator
MSIAYDRKIEYFTDGDEDYELWNLMTIARYATFRAREKELQRYNLTPGHAQILFVVQALQEKASITELSKVVLRQPHSVSTMVNRMIKLGLLKKVPVSGHKRIVILTVKGLEAYELTARRSPVHRVMRILDDKQRLQLRQILELILQKARQELGLNRDIVASSD